MPAAQRTTGQPTVGPSPEEQALRAELRELVREVWANEPGVPRARRICQAQPRLSELTRRWIRAVARTYAHRRARLEPAVEELDAALVGLEDTCAAGGVEYAPEPVEGSLQGVSEEAETLAREVDDVAAGG